MHPKLLPLLTVALKKSKDKRSDEPSDEGMPGQEELAQEVLDAMESKDAKALADALEGFISVCMHEHEEGKDEESEDHEDQEDKY